MSTDASAVPSQVPRTVLVVEDEEGVRDLVAEVLEGNGFRVLQAGNGQEAIRLAQQAGPIDLLVSDVVMPGMSGFELAKWFETQRPATKVVFMTGYTDERSINRQGLNPNMVLLQKPFSPVALLRIISAILHDLS